MSSVGYAAALAMAAVLGWAGMAKWQRPRATAESFAGLGVPAPALWARVVPFAEVVVAAVLVVVPRAGAVCALGLLFAFTVALVVALRRGAEVGCACFGAAKVRPVSTVELVRNAGLSILAATAWTVPSPVRPTVEAVAVVGAAFGFGWLGVHLLARRHADRVGGGPARVIDR